MKRIYIFLVLSVLLLWIVNGTEKKRHQKKLSAKKHTENSKVHTIPLKKRMLSKDGKTKFFNFLSQTQTMLKNPLSKGEIFLEKIQAKTRSQHEIRLANYQNTQFTGLISLTNSGNQFEAIFDTGKPLNSPTKF